MNNNKFEFTAKAFHLWPFGGRGLWRGFIENNKVSISSNDFTIVSSNYTKTFPIKDLEFVVKKNRWFRLGNPKVIIGTNNENGGWKGANVIHDYCYINLKDYANFISRVKEQTPICFSPESKMVETSIPLHKIYKLITGNRSSLWLNERHIISSEDIKSGWCIYIKDVKYFFTKGILSNDLYIGSDKTIRLENVNQDNIKTIQNYILNHGGKIAAKTTDSYKDAWTLNIIYSPSLWFAHSSIGFTDDGIVFKQKTFKTNDNIFLPFEKINMATYNSKWYWLFTKDITIFGEQNIIPKRRYSKESVKSIQKFLESKGIKSLDGQKYTCSYHSSWFGIFLSIITLSIYHWIVASFSKQTKLTVGEKKLAWDGKIYRFTADKNEKWERKEENRLSTLVLDANEIKSVVYLKKHWYHFWGYLYIWAHPHNIRSIEEDANQHSVDYDLEMSKVWSWNIDSIINSLKSAGYNKNSDQDKFYKKWARTSLNEKNK